MLCFDGTHSQICGFSTPAAAIRLHRTGHLTRLSRLDTHKAQKGECLHWWCHSQAGCSYTAGQMWPSAQVTNIPAYGGCSQWASQQVVIHRFIFPPKTKKCSRSIYDPLSSRRWDHCSDTSLHLYTLMLQVLGVLSGIEPEAEPAVKRELCSYYTLKQLKNTRWKL